jgi:hypothetical protein
MNLYPRRNGGGGQRDKESGKRVRGESGDSSLHLDFPENAVIRPTVSVLLEQGSPTVSLEIEKELKRIIQVRMFLYFNRVSRSDMKVTAIKPYGVTGEALDIKGQ